MRRSVLSTPTSPGTTSARDVLVHPTQEPCFTASKSIAALFLAASSVCACTGEVDAVAARGDAPGDLGLATYGPTTSAVRDPSAGYLLVRGSAVDPWCGAVLVDPRKVLTAARCVEDLAARSLSVGFGELKSGSIHPVQSIKLPLGYRIDGPAFDDIAILELRDPVDDVPPAILSMSAVDSEWVSLVSYPFVIAGRAGDRRVFDGQADRAGDEDLSAVFPGAETNCHGEAGAGLFRRTDGPSDELLGIGSSGTYDSPHPISPACVGRLNFAPIAHNRDFLLGESIALPAGIK
jgi:hypothetical protein